LQPRRLEPPDDIRHRALAWNLQLGTWQKRNLRSPNPSLARSRVGDASLGAKGVTYRLGRGVALRSLPNASYDRERKELRHRGSYLPIIFEACQVQERSYEYRDGAASCAAFTSSIAQDCRPPPAAA